ncbi:L,D-transpeptidase [Marinitenerispora sediminis]|uniref:L,D-transpeptidase n=1 Tax=Marinitenerispora sediminis TaxID=1931232 RepID=UPI001F16EBDC|nr:Ig-like domain-containing protein [Marinitenerispora sediminis]
MLDTPRSPILLRLGGVLAGAALVLSAGCSAGADAQTSSDETAGNDVNVTITPADGSDEVRPDLPIVVAAEGGTITDVTVQRSSDDAEADAAGNGDPASVHAITGTLNEAKTEWTSDWTLPPGSDITVTANVENPDGEASEVVSSFATLPATEGQRLELKSNFPASGDEVGVGMPIIIDFDMPVQNKAQVEAAMTLRSEQPAVGAWNWFGDQRVVFRTEEYWEPNQEVVVDMRFAGVLAAEGVYGVKNYQLRFDVGRSQISRVDNNTHRMLVERDGQQIQDFPISNGDGSRPEFRTTSGVHLTMERHRDYVMDSATIGIPEDSPGAYKLTVAYAVRFSNSGEFAHTSEGNTSLGIDNVSHGCTNMSLEDSRWFYENTLIGDPYIVTGTTRELEVDNGWGYWQRSWEDWLANSETGEADPTDDDAAPGSSQTAA